MLGDPSTADILLFEWSNKLGTEKNNSIPFFMSYFMAYKQRTVEFQQAAGLVELAKAFRTALDETSLGDVKAFDALVAKYQHLAEQREAIMVASHNNACKMIKMALDAL